MGDSLSIVRVEVRFSISLWGRRQRSNLTYTDSHQVLVVEPPPKKNPAGYVNNAGSGLQGHSAGHIFVMAKLSPAQVNNFRWALWTRVIG